MSITVTARTTFDHAGRAYAVGDLVSVAPEWAAILRDQGKVALDSDDAWRADILRATLAAATPTRRRRRAYRRRDLTAAETR